MFPFLLIVLYPVCVIVIHFYFISISLRHYRYYLLYFSLTLFSNLFSLCPFYSLLPLFLLLFCILFHSLSTFFLPLFSLFIPVVGGGHLPNSIDVTNPPFPAVVPRKRNKRRFASGYLPNNSNDVTNRTFTAVVAATISNKSNMSVPTDCVLSGMCYCYSLLFYLFFTSTL